MSYLMSDGNGFNFDANSADGRNFIKWANEIASASEDEDDPIVFDYVCLSEDNVAEAFFHDAKNTYYVRDEHNARLEYASAR